MDPHEENNVLDPGTGLFLVREMFDSNSNLFRVKRGNYMGQNFGVITAIDEGQISLKEVVQDSGGDWVERNATVQMSEGKK